MKQSGVCGSAVVVALTATAHDSCDLLQICTEHADAVVDLIRYQD